MTNNLQKKIHDESKSVKKSLSELQKVLGFIYNLEIENNSKKTAVIKRNLDKVKMSEKYLSNLNIEEGDTSLNKKDVEKIKKIRELHSLALKTIRELDNLMNDKKDLILADSDHLKII